MYQVLTIALIFCLAATAVSADATWTRVNPTPSAANLFGAASGNGRTVVTGMYPTRTSFISSNTFSNWTEIDLQPGYALSPYAASYLVAYDPAWGFVAVPSAISGGASFIWTSPDGVKWMWGNSLVSYGNTLVASHGIFVSVGGTDSIYSSHDGGNRWASIPLSSYSNTPSVIGQTFFIPVGKSEVFTTNDGINLNLYYNFSSSLYPSQFGRLMSVAHVYGCNDGSVVALLSTVGGGIILRSATQQSPVWEVVQTWDFYIGYGYFARVANLDTIFVSLPGGSLHSWQYWQSKDHGQTWQSYSNANIGFAPIAAVDQSFIMLGESGRLSQSPDGKMWISHNEGVTAGIQNAWYSSNLDSIVLATNNQILSSPNGNFTGSNAAVRSSPNLISLLEFGSGSNAYFAGVDAAGNLTVSPVAGGRWVVRLTAPEIGLRHRSYAANLLAYAEDQDIWVVSIQLSMDFSELPVFYYSTGNRWSLGQTTISPMSIGNTRSLVYGQKLFVALVNMNLNEYRVFTSSNGSLWTMNNDLLVKTNINSVLGCRLTVAGPNNKQYFFVLCSGSSTPAYVSRDGLGWKPFALPSGARFVNYLPGSDLWIATGLNGFYTAPDLTNWSKPMPLPFSAVSLFNLAVENPSTGAVAAISTLDNSIIITSNL